MVVSAFAIVGGLFALIQPKLREKRGRMKAKKRREKGFCGIIR
jgi:hypothetical protein